MIQVTVTSAELRHMQGNGKASGKPYSLFFQTVYAHTLDRQGNPVPFPEKLEIIVDKDEVGNGKPYQPGVYLLHPASIYVDRNGSFGVAPKLVPKQPK